jgi:hypothetical protein
MKISPETQISKGELLEEYNRLIDEICLLREENKRLKAQLGVTDTGA